MTIGNILDYELFTVHDATLRVWNIFWFAVVIGIAWLLIRIIKLVLNRQVIARDMDKGSVVALIQLVKYFVYTIAIVILLESVGVKMSMLLASSAAFLLAIGLGLQQVFYDIVSGILLLFEGTIRVEDVVEINQDLVGKVMHIGLRTSKIETRENIYVIVPNSKFISGDVVNWSHITKSTRFKVTVGVAYGSDIVLVKNLLLKAADKHENVEENPGPFVRFNDFGDSALDFELYFWTSETFGVENIKSDLRFKIDALFREHNVSIPFPQRDLHIRSSDLPAGSLRNL
ncbi:mechanosensitive ion channel [bacterium]|nr:mechanosensitive ion channel [bacterium]